LPNICGAIHGTHIPLASLPNKKMSFATIDFLIGKKFIALRGKQFAMYTIFLGMYVLTNLVVSMMVGSLRCLMLIDNSRIVRFYKSQWWLLQLKDEHHISLVMQYT
jgi:hypothetical protein